MSVDPSLPASEVSELASKSLRPDDIQKNVFDITKSVLGKDVGLHEPLMDAGLDSLGAVEFRNTLESVLGLQLPGTLVFDYQTVHSL